MLAHHVEILHTNVTINIQYILNIISYLKPDPLNSSNYSMLCEFNQCSAELLTVCSSSAPKIVLNLVFRLPFPSKATGNQQLASSQREHLYRVCAQACLLVCTVCQMPSSIFSLLHWNVLSGENCRMWCYGNRCALAFNERNAHIAQLYGKCGWLWGATHGSLWDILTPRDD